jgi:hypothetical protein
MQSNGPALGSCLSPKQEIEGAVVTMQAENSNVYYSAVAGPDGQNPVNGRLEAQPSSGENLTEQVIMQALEVLVDFQRRQRAQYYPLGQPLTPPTKSFFARFFDPSLLGQVRILKMTGERVPNPPFLEVARQIGFQNLPDLTHQSTVTFMDVILFNEQFTERALFNGLVHATQVQILGVERFAEFLIRGSLRTKSYMMIPLKAHAFALDCQFAEHRERGFSVEAEVARWLEQGRY